MILFMGARNQRNLIILTCRKAQKGKHDDVQFAVFVEVALQEVVDLKENQVKNNVKNLFCFAVKLK